MSTFTIEDIREGKPPDGARESKRADGYRGIWFTLSDHPFEYGHKYSGGLGTYTANHQPMAVHAPAVNKTFFTYGGTTAPEALADLAAAGRIRVALDIFQREPLPPDSPLRKVDAALLSPPIAGPTRDALPSCGAFALENLRRYFAGQPVEGRVTLEIYDRTT